MLTYLLMTSLTYFLMASVTLTFASPPTDTTTPRHPPLESVWIDKGDKTYKVFKNRYVTSFQNAKTICQQVDAVLPQPKNKEENDHLATLDSSRFYLGMTDQQTEGTWVWDTDQYDVTWFNWAQWPDSGAVPNGGDEQNCAMMLMEFYNNMAGHRPEYWGDFPCNHEARDVVCQEKASHTAVWVLLIVGPFTTIVSIYLTAYIYTNRESWRRNKDLRRNPAYMLSPARTPRYILSDDPNWDADSDDSPDTVVKPENVVVNPDTDDGTDVQVPADQVQGQVQVQGMAVTHEADGENTGDVSVGTGGE